MSREIIVSKRAIAIVDDEDYEYLNQFKWYLSNGYAISSSFKGNKGLLPSRTKMSRLILNPAKGKLVDHKDRNKLNNTRGNLREVDREGNVHNQQKRTNTNNNYKGTQFIKRLNIWQARCRIYGKDYFLGHYRSEIAAAYAYNKKASELSTCILLNKIGIPDYEAEKLLISDFVKLKPAEKQSGVKGVYWNKDKNKWDSVCFKGKKRKHIGSYKELPEAINAYNSYTSFKRICNSFGVASVLFNK